MELRQAQLDGIFLAFADPTRRAVLARLAAGPASVSDLARPFAMALPSFMRHVRMLEESGLVATSKAGRVRTCQIQKKAFETAEAWMAGQRAVWEARTDRLEQFLAEQQKDSPK